MIDPQANSYARDILLQKYPKILEEGGVDLNNDGTVQVNEKVDANKDGQIDNEEAWAFLNANRGVLAREIDFVNPNVAQLSRDNRFRHLFLMEAEVYPKEKIEEAYQILVKLIGEIKHSLEEAERNSLGPLRLVDKVKLAYSEMNKTFEFSDQENPLFSENLCVHSLDCDTSSFVILALADELKASDPQWANIGLVVVPGHTVLCVEGTYIDFGFPYKQAETIMTPLYGDAIHEIFYFNIGLAKRWKRDYAGALTAYQKALEINPMNEATWNNLGYIHYRLKDYQKAITAYTLSLEINPTYRKAQINLFIVQDLQNYPQ